MANKDYTLARPMQVTITNTAADVEVFDAGTRASKATVLATSVRPNDIVIDSYSITDSQENTTKYAVVKRKYKSGDRAVQIFKHNTYVTLGSLETLTVTPTSAAELAYYDSLSKDFTVAIEEVDAEEEPAPIEVVDKSALESAISAAELLLSSTTVGAEEGEVPQQDHDDYDQAVSAAKIVLNNDEALQTEVDQAIATLGLATTAFNEAIITG